MLGFIFVISPMVLSCSDSEEPGVEPDVPVNPDVPLPPNPTPIRWVENEVDGGERGVGIKVTSNTEHNFVFECTPGSKVQSYRLDVYPLCRMYNYLLESVGAGVQATEEEVEEAPGLGKPVLVMRDTTERPEALASGTVHLVGTDYDKIMNEVSTLLDDAVAYEAMSKAVNPYGDGQACRRIADVLAGKEIERYEVC